MNDELIEEARKSLSHATGYIYTRDLARRMLPALENAAARIAELEAERGEIAEKYIAESVRVAIALHEIADTDLGTNEPLQYDLATRVHAALVGDPS